MTDHSLVNLLGLLGEKREYSLVLCTSAILESEM